MLELCNIHFSLNAKMNACCLTITNNTSLLHLGQDLHSKLTQVHSSFSFFNLDLFRLPYFAFSGPAASPPFVTDFIYLSYVAKLSIPSEEAHLKDAPVNGRSVPRFGEPSVMTVGDDILLFLFLLLLELLV